MKQQRDSEFKRSPNSQSPLRIAVVGAGIARSDMRPRIDFTGL